MSERQEPLRTDSNQIELVDFRIYEKQADGTAYEGIYGINVSKVREILVLPPLARVPDAHPAIAGIFNLRGTQVPAVDLVRWLEIEEFPPEGIRRKVIVTEFSNQTIGLIVHQTSRIRRIPWSEIKPPPPLVVRKHGGAVVGTTMIGESQTLLLIDVERIVTEIQGQTVDEQIEAGLGDSPITQHRGRLLVVDDSGVARKQLNLTLKKAGYEVVEAADGQEALDWLGQLKERVAEAGRRVIDDVQMVIADVEMPRMDGYSLTVAIKKDEQLRDLPVVMHSSLGGQANVNRGREAGCDEYVVKFEPFLLLEAVERVLGGGQ